MKAEMVTTLKRQATKILADLNATHEPVLITEQGRPAAYLVNVEDYEFQQKRLRLLEGIARGERAIQQGRVVSQTDAEAKLQKWLT
ncbi:type II toxin-antitoxin system Phd/YefM family antitoxin [Thiomicrospira sp. R3]|uniref:type II toxin-antitoxin system Phd/YefM family antitoxin n=1 Tax=Thiomicrospira sp. R3 TaxID=3035472 RepID=UPI00259B8339|nr:type II toxin-antitoxin system Phd/YefM family antitoxin [Thiomicrospira sp. R3]WFE68107.1 type II toxin-antitoxin system Phd/YefM family antitoxin [Thiomicrospira sp. R3]